MKKLVRSEKVKLVETAKTLVVVLLFFSSLFLGYRILRLYKAQANVEGAIWGSMGIGAEVMDSGNKARMDIISDRPQARIIAANRYNTRALIDEDSQIFEDLDSMANRLLGEVYQSKGEAVIAVDSEEWHNVLNSNSVYLRYPVTRYLSTETIFYGLKSGNPAGKIPSFEEVLVTYGRGDTVSVYISQIDKEKILKADISGETARIFKEKAKKADFGDTKNYTFAHELNLDERGEKGKAVLDSTLLIPIKEEAVEDIAVNVPKLYKSGLNFTKATDMTLGLVNIFNYNPNTIRQYVNRDNSIMFVGETGSLSLRPNGLIEYKALDAEDGVPLSGKKELADITSGLCAMIEKIMRTGGINTVNTDFKLKCTHMPANFRVTEKTEIGFDYFVKDKKLEFANSYGIWAVVQNGNLIELKMYLKDIEVLDQGTLMPGMFDAIDRFCADNPEYSKVRRAYGVYKHKEDGTELKAEWKLEGAR